MAFTEINFDEARTAVVAIRLAGDECGQSSVEATANLGEVDAAVEQLRATEANVNRLLDELDSAVSGARDNLNNATWNSGSRDNLVAAIAEVEAIARTARTNYQGTYSEALLAAERLRVSIEEITRVFTASCDRNGPAFLDAADKGDAHIAEHERLSSTGIASA